MELNKITSPTIEKMLQNITILIYGAVYFGKKCTRILKKYEYNRFRIIFQQNITYQQG